MDISEVLCTDTIYLWTCTKTCTWYTQSCCLFCKIHEKQLCHIVTKIQHSSVPSKWSSQFCCTKTPLMSYCHNSPGGIHQVAVAGLGRGMSPESWQNVLWNSPKLNDHVTLLWVIQEEPHLGGANRDDFKARVFTPSCTSKTACNSVALGFRGSLSGLFVDTSWIRGLCPPQQWVTSS